MCSCPIPSTTHHHLHWCSTYTSIVGYVGHEYPQVVLVRVVVVKAVENVAWTLLIQNWENHCIQMCRGGQSRKQNCFLPYHKLIQHGFPNSMNKALTIHYANAHACTARACKVLWISLYSGQGPPQQGCMDSNNATCSIGCLQFH